MFLDELLHFNFWGRNALETMLHSYALFVDIMSHTDGFRIIKFRSNCTVLCSVEFTGFKYIIICIYNVTRLSCYVSCESSEYIKLSINAYSSLTN
jgi:hypothetical protein